MSTTGEDLIAVHLNDGAGRIAKERKRQITEGTTPKRSDYLAELTMDELVATGARFAAEIDRRLAAGESA